jgi:uncharacterized protein YdeI (YjbR/CyaY-like superfamily)
MKTPKTVELCPTLRQALRSAPKTAVTFAVMPPSHQREYNQWVAAAKKAETQTARAEKALAMIAAWGKKKPR